MSNSNTTVTYGGPGFLGLLGLLFIGLRVAGVITWPWVWVLAPLWIPFALALLVFIVFGIIFLISEYRK